MIAYKVFKREGKNLVSCVANGKAKVYYRQGEKVFPPKWLADSGYGITCFINKYRAERFINAEFVRPEEVFIKEVEIDENERKFELPEKSDIRDLNEGKLKTYPGSSCIWPEGTIMVPWVKVV